MGSLHARFLVHAVAAAGLAAGCVDDFGGSNIQIDFRPSVPTNAAPGTTPALFQPPPDTYYVLYAVDQVRDDAGVITAEYLFEVQRFEIRPAVDLASPCAIEVEGQGADVYPGLHISAFVDKLREVYSVADPIPPGTDPEIVTRITTAIQRVDNAAEMDTIKAVTSTSVTRYPAVAATCVEDDPGVDPTLLPPPTCFGDTPRSLSCPACPEVPSNARRLQLCRAVWTSDPLLYEGTDRVLTAPLAGQIFGFVLGVNPINAAPLGGAGLFVDEVLAADAYAINWQFKDLDRDGMPEVACMDGLDNDLDGLIDCADSNCAAAANCIPGFGFMSGIPESRTRGVISVEMVHPGNANISALLSIFANLDDDPIQF